MLFCTSKTRCSYPHSVHLYSASMYGDASSMDTATNIHYRVCRFEFEVVPPEPGDKYNRLKPTVENVTRDKVSYPFIEIDWCWGYIGYVNILRYHVEREEEVKRTSKWFSWFDARNTDIVLDEAKIAGLIRVALERTKHSAAQNGSGMLSSFAS